MLLWLPMLAFAYETDQITWRERALQDAAPVANEIMNRLLSSAIEHTNARAQCSGSDDDVQMILAEEIYRATSLHHGVRQRKGLRSVGFSIFSAALEQDPRVDKFAFAHRQDIYGGLDPWQSVVLTFVGPCSTFEVSGVRMGSDKFEHFLGNGYYYLRDAARWGSALEAIERGTATERSIYGLMTSKAFSFADLRANYDGYIFYRDLLDESSILQRDDEGCVEMVRPFDWGDWVRPEWDELLNPPIYTRLVERGVLKELQGRRDEVCASWRWWGDLVASARGDLSLYAAGPSPSPRDPWQLETLCADELHEPLSPWPMRPRQEMKQQKRAR